MVKRIEETRLRQSWNPCCHGRRWQLATSSANLALNPKIWREGNTHFWHQYLLNTKLLQSWNMFKFFQFQKYNLRHFKQESLWVSGNQWAVFRELHNFDPISQFSLHFTILTRCHNCGFCSNRILHYFPSVRVSVTGVISHIFHIYKGINAMLIIRGPIKTYIFWIKIILAIFLAKTRPVKTIFSALTNLTIDFDRSKI